MSNNDVIVSGLASNVTLALNTTYYGYLVPINSFNGSLSVLYIVPCRLDTIYITNPQASLNITVPFSTYVASVHNYVYYGKLSQNQRSIGRPLVGGFGVQELAVGLNTKL
ncbi:hypothetical protein [Vulcanisaeta souniana]|uniref:hypothetical protein n=1 Tax=Vulcanisaeta souniana TaxID=164452 RepID=UPI0006D0147D|nr:hypothetical protein [Vulcanisaeta souniana]